MPIACVLALALTPAADVAVITPEQAKAHGGQDVAVQGQVAQIGTSDHELFLNFGGLYPDHPFNAVIPSRNLRSFPDSRAWAGKLIRVRGRIQLYRGGGKLEIILERPDQVTLDPTPIPQGVAPERREGGVEESEPGSTLRGISRRDCCGPRLRLRLAAPADQAGPPPVPPGGI